MAAPTGAEAGRIAQVWEQALEKVRQVARSPVFFRALERSVPIAQEDGFFVVGAQGMESQHTAAFNTTENQLLMEKALRDVTGDTTLRFRFVDGNSYSDWEFAKQRDAALRSQQAQSVQKKVAETQTAGSWEEVYDQVSRLWANSENRNIASGKGRYLNAALTLLADSMTRLYPTDSKADDATERAFARVIERIASLAGSDPAVVAYLLLDKVSNKP